MGRPKGSKDAVERALAVHKRNGAVEDYAMPDGRGGPYPSMFRVSPASSLTLDTLVMPLAETRAFVHGIRAGEAGMLARLRDELDDEAFQVVTDALRAQRAKRFPTRAAAVTHA